MARSVRSAAVSSRAQAPMAPRWRATPTTNRSACDCRWALRGCVGLGDGSHCWRQCCSPGSPAKLVVVTQTHVLTKPLIDRLRQAHRQLTRRGLAYFVAFLIGDGSEDRCDNPQHPRAALLRELRKAIGAAAVWCVDPPLFQRVWPTFFTELSALPTRERYPKPGAIGGWQCVWPASGLNTGAVPYRVCTWHATDRDPAFAPCSVRGVDAVRLARAGRPLGTPYPRAGERRN